MADKENSPELQFAPAKEEKGNKESKSFLLPVLGEFIVTVSTSILVVIFLIVLTLSLWNGSRLVDLVIRVGVTTLVIGGLLVLIVRQVVAGMVRAGMVKEETLEEPGSPKVK